MRSPVTKRSFLHHCGILAATVVFILAAADACASEKVLLSFRDSAMVIDTVVVLGDVARIRAEDKGLRNSLEKTVIGESAPAGFSRFASAAEIVRLSLAPRFGGVYFEAEGSARTRIATDCRTVAVEDLADTVTAFLRSRLSWPQADVTIEVENASLTRKILHRPFTTEITGLENSYAKGPVRLIAILVQGTKKTRIPVVCRVKVTTEVVVATATIQREQPIDAFNSEIRRIDVTGYSFAPYESFDRIRNQVAARTISPGTVIHTNLVRALPAVRKGDQFYVTLERGSVSVSVLVRAREDAKAGERVWVENLSTHKLLRVIVEDRTHARLVPEEEAI